MKKNRINDFFNQSMKSNVPFSEDFIDQIITSSPFEPSIVVKHHLPFKLALSALSVFVLAFFSFLFYRSYQTVTASFTVDINPSVSIDINRYDKVIAINPINEDGETVITSMTSQKGSIDSVLEELMKTSEELGFVSSDTQAVLIGVSAETEEDQLDLEEQLSTLFDQYTYSVFMVENSTINIEPVFQLFPVVRSTLDETYSPDINASETEDQYNSIIDSIIGDTQSTNTDTEYSYTDMNSMYLYYMVNYNISEAHLKIIVAITLTLEEYQNEEAFLSLFDLSIDELLEIYNYLP